MGNPTEGSLIGKSDYAANAGDLHFAAQWNSRGPANLAEVDVYRGWCNSENGGVIGSCNPSLAGQVPDRITGPDGTRGTYWTNTPDTDTVNGVSFQRSRISFKHITDGSSNTYAVGEKYLNPESYEESGYLSYGDDKGWTTGVSDDMHRCASFPPMQDAIRPSTSAEVPLTKSKSSISTGSAALTRAGPISRFAMDMWNRLVSTSTLTSISFGPIVMMAKSSPSRDSVFSNQHGWYGQG